MNIDSSQNNVLEEDWKILAEEIFVENSQHVPNEGTNSSCNDNKWKKISDAITYGPKFCELFETYKTKLSFNIDISRHLMSLCVDHLITFINWARESDKQINWITNKLNNYDYLRPEVRNGIIFVLIYTFASIKSTIVKDSDMFIELEDHDHGLGIANKFSLKVYNDPYNYLIFLKIALSSLIDAKAVFENERINRPRKYKEKLPENEEEITAFHHIRNTLTSLLDAGNNIEARNFVAKITNFWQTYGNVIRYCRFSKAWVHVANSSALPTIDLVCGVSVKADNDCKKRQTINFAEVNPNRKNAKCRDSLSTDSCSSGLLSLNCSNNAIHRDVNNIHVPILIFDRIGINEWNIRKVKIYDIVLFFESIFNSNTMNKSFYFIDEGRLSVHNNMSIKHDNNVICNLEQKLQQQYSLVTSWKLKNEFQQLLAWLQHFQVYQRNHNNNNNNQISLLQFWLNDTIYAIKDKKSFNFIGKGVLAFENNMHIIFIIRQNHYLNISKDMWCYLYQNELQQILTEEINTNPCKKIIFGDLLNCIFPQLFPLKNNIETNYDNLFPLHGKEIVVKYFVHDILSINNKNADEKVDIYHQLSKVPELPNRKVLQTIGTYLSPAEEILAKLHVGIVVHDISFEYIQPAATSLSHCMNDIE